MVGTTNPQGTGHGVSLDPSFGRRRVDAHRPRQEPVPGPADDRAESTSGIDTRLWTVTELAAFLGVSRSTLFRIRERGAGPRSIKLGSAVRFRRADVETWLNTIVSES